MDEAPPLKKSRTAWTKEEEAVVLEFFGKLSLKEIGQKIGRSKGQVKLKAYKLGCRAKKASNQKDANRDIRVWKSSEEIGLKETTVAFNITMDQVKSARRRVFKRREIVRKKMAEPEFFRWFVSECHKAAALYSVVHEAEEFVSWAVTRALDYGANPYPQSMIRNFIAHILGSKSEETDKRTKQDLYRAKEIVEEYNEDRPGAIVVAQTVQDHKEDTLLKIATILNFNDMMRLVFLLYFIENLSYATIGQYLNVSTFKVFSMIGEAKEKIKNSKRAMRVLLGNELGIKR